MTARPATYRELGIMQGFPPPADKRPPPDAWDLGPWNRWSFQNVRGLLPTVNVPCGVEVPLEEAGEDLSGVRVGGQSLSDVLDATYTDGFLVMHRGRVVFERYFNDMAPATLHLSQSVAKSVTAAVAGVLWGRGVLDLQAPLASMVPELAACGYGDATLDQVLDMRSGVRFDESYNHPDSDMTRIDIACGWRPCPPGARRETLRDVILTLPKERPHGGAFSYRSVETDVIAWVLERVAGKPLADLVAETVWGPIGAGHDACFTVDPAGTALADGGFNATLRDYARFGEMMRQGGRAGGRQVVPEAWVEETRTGDPSAFGAPYTTLSPKGAYRRQFWIHDVARRDFMARGVFGQLIYIDPAAEMTVVKLSTWPEYLRPDLSALTLRAIAAIRALVAQS